LHRAANRSIGNVPSRERTAAQRALKPAELSTPTFCTLQRELSSRRRHRMSADRPHPLKRLSGVNDLPDDDPHDDFAAPAAARRPSAAGSRPQHGGPDHRHGSWGSSLDGPWLAPNGAEGRGNHGRDEREDIGTPAKKFCNSGDA